jgi:hypothetical protein
MAKMPPAGKLGEGNSQSLASGKFVRQNMHLSDKQLMSVIMTMSICWSIKIHSQNGLSDNMMSDKLHLTILTTIEESLQ